MYHPNYRPDIDGLRAIAVLGVIIHHSGLLTTGGFIGVDVFFVISGYLITRNILGDQAQNQFSLATFYTKRIRRIVPTLLSVIGVSVIYGWLYLLPSAFVQFAKSAITSIFFTSNIWFYFQDNYHAAESSLRPLLHTWSLGIEEQFYLLFPLLMLATSNFSKARKLKIIAVIIVVSLLLASHLSTRHTELNFYFLPSRIWELGVGCLAALLAINATRLSESLRTVVSLFGLALIIGAFATFDSNTPHPGLPTMVPVIGSAAIILFGDGTRTIQWLIGNQVMSFIGRISYSLYLWHFPVFAFAKLKNVEVPLTAQKSIELLAIIFVLSLLSFYLIEKPFRDPQRVKPRHFNVILTAAIIGLLTTSLYVISKDGLTSRLGDLEQIFEGSKREDSFLLKNGKHCIYRPWNPNSCHFSVSPNAANIISTGDSHANAISNPLKIYAEEEGYNFYNMVLSHCPFVLDAWRVTGFKTECSVDQMDSVRDFFKKFPPSIIVYSARWPMYLNHRPFDNSEGGRDQSLFLPFYPSNQARKRGEDQSTLIPKTFMYLAELGHKVIIVYPVPEVGWNVPDLINERLDKVPKKPLGRKREAFQNLSITTSYEVYKKRVKHSKSILDVAQHDNIYRVYPEEVFCSDETGRCTTHSNEKLFYYDNNHLSRSGSHLLTKKIADTIEQITSERITK